MTLDEFFKQYKKDLIKQVLQNIKDNHNNNRAEARIIKNINKQETIDEIRKQYLHI